MSFEWRETTLGAICQFAAGSAFAPDQQGVLEGEHPFIKVSDMNLPGNEVFIRSANNYVSESQRALMKAKLHPVDAVVFAKIGVALTSNRRRQLICQTIIDNNMMSATADLDLVRPKFLYYLLTTVDFNTISAGTALPYLNVSDLRKISVAIPSLDAQAAIESMLASLDDRIALLRETNATLQAIAQALFKSWFVDFDPVRAKSQGLAPAGMDEATAVLFPEKFEEARRGAVPHGWRELSIYEVAQVVYGAPFASSRFNTDRIGRPLVRIRDLRDEAPGVHTDEVHPKGYLLRPGDIVVGMDGEFRAYLWGGDEAWLNQRVCVFQPRAGVPATFVRATIEPQLAHIEATETATTVIHLGKGDIDRFVALLPPDEVLAAFAEVTDPLYARIVANKQTCRSLAAVRDTLLPRLISGQLRLPEVVGQAEEALA